MSVTTVEPDLDNLTLTVVADFEASVEAVWELWANSEKLGALVGTAGVSDDLRALRLERRRRDGPRDDGSRRRRARGRVADRSS